MGPDPALDREPLATGPLHCRGSAEGPPDSAAPSATFVRFTLRARGEGESCSAFFPSPGWGYALSFFRCINDEDSLFARVT